MAGLALVNAALWEDILLVVVLEKDGDALGGEMEEDGAGAFDEVGGGVLGGGVARLRSGGGHCSVLCVLLGCVSELSNVLHLLVPL